MIKLLLTIISEYIDGGYKRLSRKKSPFKIDIYEVTGCDNNKNGDTQKFTRIDIFTESKK
jgi:hypothetical protein